MSIVMQRNNLALLDAIGPVASGLSRTPPTWAEIRQRINEAAKAKGEWGGLPKPIEGLRLVLEPRHPFKGLNGAMIGEDANGIKPPTGDEDYTLLNSWRCERRNSTAYVCREANGQSRVYLLPDGANTRLTFWLHTLGVAASETWDVDAERNACDKLREMVSEHAWRCYMLSGSFLETSRRSGVTYLFRKLRPTVALRPNRHGTVSAIACLCLHPIGYYERTWAGVMCPTDDVVAHLMMMRGDEAMFWRKANHHRPESSMAGI